jgi:glycosyltransferase involved in cell wall biosynthesis
MSSVQVASVAKPQLRLLIVNYEFPPIGGGASFACFGLAQTLVSRGHVVDVLTSRLSGQPAVETIQGIRVQRVRSWRHGPHNCGLRGAATFLLCAWWRLRQLLKVEQYDLVHYFFGLPSGVLALYTHGVCGLPYIVSLRGSDVPGYDPENRLLNLTHQAVAGLNRYIWRHATQVVPNSMALRDLAAAFEPSIDFKVIPNAVVHEVTPPQTSQQDDAPLQVLCVARLIERKGISTLLRAFAQLPLNSSVLHLAGDGPDAESLKKLAQELNLSDRVIFHGVVAHDEVLHMYLHCDIFVLPTLSESCSMALLEAMSYGLPIVTTRVGGNPFLIEQWRNGVLVAPGDAEELARSLHALLTDRALRQTMSAANLKKITEEFTWTINAQRFEHIYQAALLVS